MASSKQAVPRKRRGFIFEMRRNGSYYLMILPAAFFLFAFAYVPLPGIIIAFMDYNFRDGFRSPFVGFANFRFYFTSPMAVRTTFNTLYINFLQLIWINLVGVLFAIFLSELRGKFAKRFYQNAIFLPFFFSVIIISQLVTRIVFVDGMGIANQIIAFFGGEPRIWSRDPGPWRWIVVLTNTWRQAGWMTIIYLATITGINPELYESSALDGASRLRQIWHIMMPMLVPTILIMMLLAIGGALRGDFGLIHSITQGIDRPHLLRHVDIIETFVFRAIRPGMNFSVAAAIGLYQSLVGFILVFGSNALVKLYEKDYALF